MNRVHSPRDAGDLLGELQDALRPYLVAAACAVISITADHLQRWLQHQLTPSVAIGSGVIQPS